MILRSRYAPTADIIRDRMGGDSRRGNSRPSSLSFNFVCVSGSGSKRAIGLRRVAAAMPMAKKMKGVASEHGSDRCGGGGDDFGPGLQPRPSSRAIFARLLIARRERV